jgi:SAM-dependent MidA family methyltransferase
VNLLADKIRDEIVKHGPLAFSRFMEMALYDPDFGYYRRAHHPFGRRGDFYTAEQLQPVFGRLISAAIENLYQEMGCPEDFTVVELGAGRGEMADALSRFRYTPIEIGPLDIGQGQLPERFTGIVFSNEFFDALPVDIAIRQPDGWRERRVGLQGDKLTYVTGPPVDRQTAHYLERYATAEQQVIELHEHGAGWLKRIAERLTTGFVLTIDYGYTRSEAIRFPQGSLMSYHKHQASEDVLRDPGIRDITSHVPFTILKDEGTSLGLSCVRLQTLAQFLIELGEEVFIEAVTGGHELQLKTLLFGMGESFRVLLQRKSAQNKQVTLPHGA